MVSVLYTMGKKSLHIKWNWVLVYVMFRSSQGDVHTHGAVPAVPAGGRGAVLHQGQPAPAVRHLDQGQAPAGALPNQGHCHHEQRLAAVHACQPEPPRPLHLHAI